MSDPFAPPADLYLHKSSIRGELIDETPTETQVDEAGAPCKRADLVIFELYHAPGNGPQLELARRAACLACFRV